MTDFSTNMSNINFNRDKLKKSVETISKKYGVERVYLFGSHARNEANADSDVDIRIDKGTLRGLFQLAGFQLELEESLGVKVDVLTTQSLDESFLTNIKRDEVVIYERNIS